MNLHVEALTSLGGAAYSEMGRPHCDLTWQQPTDSPMWTVNRAPVCPQLWRWYQDATRVAALAWLTQLGWKLLLNTTDVLSDKWASSGKKLILLQ